MPKNDGSGHYYRDGKRIDITWGEKIADGVRKHYEQAMMKMNCVVCGSQFESPKKHAKYCSYECGKKSKYYDLPPIKKKARVLGANLLMGKGKGEILEGMIMNALDTPCRYCGEILTMETLSLDHIEAYGDSKARYNKSCPVNRELRRKMDRPENLQMICRSCNGSKGDFHHREFQALLDMDERYPGIVAKLRRRLQQAKMSWGTKRIRGRK